MNYRPARRERRCGACLSFRLGPQGPSCERVEDPIGPAMCCDLWRPLKHDSRPSDGGPEPTHEDPAAP